MVLEFPLHAPTRRLAQLRPSPTCQDDVATFRHLAVSPSPIAYHSAAFVRQTSRSQNLVSIKRGVEPVGEEDEGGENFEGGIDS